MNDELIKSLSQEILQRVDNLGTAITNGAADVYGVLVQYYFISGLAHLFAVGVGAGLLVAGVKYLLYYTSALCGCSASDDVKYIWGAILSGSAVITGFLLVIINLYSGLMRTFAPEGVAMINLVNLLK